ncbi:DUF3267 domain-containing protein [Lederbergia graminis]|uniref:DUF3267 domain-containing protein n=1 Tax=Lederbergia graminis TaxID=735518 RepID=A0ABW0LH96_9BACI|nr:DUF3267 domain-containing protein [Bacillaceae bacterium]
MHCWKSFNGNKKNLFYRNFAISIFVSFFVFIAIFVPTQAMGYGHLKDNNFLIFLCAFILLYPVHKLFHILPILSHRKEMKIDFEYYFLALPVINITINKPIQIRQFLIALLFPCVIINLLLIAAIFLFPHYVHYSSILIAIHFGLCTVDFMYAKNLITSPSGALVEENENGYEILIKDNQ